MLPTGDPTASLLKPVPAPATEGWGPSSARPEHVAASVAKAMRSMAGVTGEALSVLRTPEASGSVRSIFRVRDSKVYRVDYVVVREQPTSGMIQSDGKKRTIPNREGIGKSAAYDSKSPDARLTARQLVERWPSEFTRLMWRGLTDRTDPWAPLVGGLMRGDGGFKAIFEERVTAFQGQKLKNYRIRAVRSDQAAKTLGPCELEMVFDGRFSLPVTIRVTRKDPKGREWKMQWSAGFNFRQKVGADEFTVK